MANDSLGDRMKANYESVWIQRLVRRMPVIMRLDGKSFHTLTKNCEKPFDKAFIKIMIETTKYLMSEAQGCKCGYVQSDEISLLLVDYDKFETQAWFSNEIQKIVSISAGIASAYFTKEYGKLASFDSRVFNVPREEVCNYFIWRQKDWIRNSIQMLGQANFSHKQLQNKSCADIQDMLHEKNINWAKLPLPLKNGSFILRETINDRTCYIESCPIFTQNRNIIDELLIPSEE
jgi:tRNA(His) 5'-end guanylyltransferase